MTNLEAKLRYEENLRKAKDLENMKLRSKLTEAKLTINWLCGALLIVTLLGIVGVIAW